MCPKSVDNSDNITSVSGLFRMTMSGRGEGMSMSVGVVDVPVRCVGTAKISLMVHMKEYIYRAKSVMTLPSFNNCS